MDSVLESALRKFISEDHIRNVLAGEWVDLFDNHGHQLPGIRGRIGVSALGISNMEIGLDLMEMQPGSFFPPHTHTGDHIIYVLSGCGVVRVGGTDSVMKEGDSVFIPAELPHGFNADSAAQQPLVFIAVGHPHQHLSSVERMKLVGGAQRGNHENSEW
jgi:quercetin dioxygenase-like cupin family protein